MLIAYIGAPFQKELAIVGTTLKICFIKPSPGTRSPVFLTKYINNWLNIKILITIIRRNRLPVVIAVESNPLLGSHIM